jgi:hypothetical protein
MTEKEIREREKESVRDRIRVLPSPFIWAMGESEPSVEMDGHE